MAYYKLYPFMTLYAEEKLNMYLNVIDQHITLIT